MPPVTKNAAKNSTKNSTKATVPQHDEAADERRGEDYLDGAMTGKHGVRTGRTYVAEFDLSLVEVVPEENYRWGSDEAMRRDLELTDVTNDDGSAESSFSKLRTSIAKVGVQDPVGLVLRPDGRYHVFFGFTRTMAAKMAKLATVPAFVYEPTISEAEVEMLQMLENATELKRKVNWVQEYETFKELHARFLNRLPMDTPNRSEEAARRVCEILGKHPSSMKSRKHYLLYLDPRVTALAEAGHLSVTAAIEFISGGIHNLFTKEFIGDVLEELKVNGAYPEVMTPEYVRNAMRKVRIRSANKVTNEDGAEKRGKTPMKVRQSPAILRDVAVLIARRLLLHNSMTLNSPSALVERLTISAEWMLIQGLGMGAGDAQIPPVLDQVEGARGQSDDEGLRVLQDQHEASCAAYATKAFVEAFVQNAMHRIGIRDVGCSDSSGWMAQYSSVTVKGTTAAGKPTESTKSRLNRHIYHDAIHAACEPSAQMVSLHARACTAWAAIRPVLGERAARSA